ncbi:MAG: glycosyltransferase [Ferrimicrobium acidiphilum]
MSARSRPARVMLVTFGPFASPDGGMAVRSVMVARCLAVMGVAVHVLSIGESDVTSSQHRSVEPVNTKSSKSIDTVRVTALPQSPRFALGTRARRLLRFEASRYDAVIVESALLLPALWLAGVRRPIIWDTNELETLHYSRLPKSLSVSAKWVIWFLLENWSARRADVVVSSSSADALEWARVVPATADKLMVADHAVLDGPVGSCQSKVGRRGDVVFVGTLRAKHNLAAAEWILQDLVPRLEGNRTRFVLAGRDTDCLMSDSPDVRLLGFVEDISQVIAGASVCIAPLRTAAGVSTKILDYIHLGSRVLATPVAAAGLEDCPGITIASLDEFPAVLQELLGAPEDSQEAADRRAAQAEWYEGHCGQAHLAEQWMAILERAGVSPGEEG